MSKITDHTWDAYNAYLKSNGEEQIGDLRPDQIEALKQEVNQLRQQVQALQNVVNYLQAEELGRRTIGG